MGIIDNYKLDRQVLTLEDMGTIISMLKGINTTFKDKQLDKVIKKIHALILWRAPGLHGSQLICFFLRLDVATSVQ